MKTWISAYTMMYDYHVGPDELILLTEQNLDLLEPHNLVPSGVFTLDGMLKYGEQHKQCPYFSVRRMVGNKVTLEVARG